MKNNDTDEDEFYIGWETKAPVETGRFVTLLIGAMIVGVALISGVVASKQSTIGSAVFEWSKARAFAGTLQMKPVPRLSISGPNGHTSGYLLVAPWKFGLSSENAAQWDGKSVELNGKLIYREGRKMIEVVPGSIVSGNVGGPSSVVQNAIGLGQQTLVGEIVDSKCHLGVMNPGRRTTHRACAVRCISGGVPPILLTQTPDGIYEYYLLVGTDGRALNKEVLDWIAEPVAMSGTVERHGDWLVLKVEPSTIERL